MDVIKQMEEAYGIRFFESQKNLFNEWVKRNFEAPIRIGNIDGVGVYIYPDQQSLKELIQHGQTNDCK